MNAQKEAEYIAEIVELKYKLKKMSLSVGSIGDINRKIDIIDQLGDVEWRFIPPEESMVKTPTSVAMDLITIERTPPKLIAIKKEIID